MEIFASNMKQLPSFVERRLRELRHLDTVTRDESTRLNLEERALLDEIANLTKNSTDFDEAPLRVRFNTIMSRRQLLLNTMEKQVKKVQHAYDVIDGRILFLGNCTKEIIPDVAGQGVGLDRKKKKRKRDNHDSFNQPTFELPVIDPNEPVYCICRQVSHGEMVACDNPECAIEWFHFSCVGLTETPKEDWFCPDCQNKKDERS